MKKTIYLPGENITCLLFSNPKHSWTKYLTGYFLLCIVPLVNVLDFKSCVTLKSPWSLHSTRSKHKITILFDAIPSKAINIINSKTAFSFCHSPQTDSRWWGCGVGTSEHSSRSGLAMGAMPPPPVPDKDYLLCTSWHFLVKIM